MKPTIRQRLLAHLTSGDGVINDGDEDTDLEAVERWAVEAAQAEMRRKQQA